MEMKLGIRFHHCSTKSMFVKLVYTHSSTYFLTLFHLDMINHMMCGFDQMSLIMNLIVMCNFGS